MVGVRRSQYVKEPVHWKAPAHLLHLYLQCLYLIMNIKDTLLCTLEHILSVHFKLGYLREGGEGEGQRFRIVNMVHYY